MGKKALLLVLFVLSIGKLSAFDFAFGGLVYGQFNKTNTLGTGVSLGLGGKRSNTVILNLLVGTDDMGIFTGTQKGWMDVRGTVDWHALALNLSIIQLYLGLGIGGNVGFNVEQKYSPFELSLFARLPLGVKVFLGSLELFFEFTPELGWMNTSQKIESVHLSKNDVYWAFTAYTGLRFWL